MDFRKSSENLMRAIEDFFSIKTKFLENVIELCVARLKTGGKILIFGNGGSAAQAQHFSAELVNKFLKERNPIRALSLTTDTSSLTSIANDTSFDLVFSRQIEALGDRKDVAIALSTSGNSPNVIEAVKVAKKRGLLSIALTGEGGGKLASFCDYLLDVPSVHTPRIQEVHLFLLHLLAEGIEERME